MITSEDLSIAVEHAMKNLRRAVRNVRKFHGKNIPVFPKIFIDHPVVHLTDDLLKETRVFSNRTSMLRSMPLPKNGVCCEIGTSTGIFAKQILQVLQPSKLHIIDIDFSRFENAIRDVPGVHVHEGDSAKYLGSLPDKYFDYAYVDADHSYASVRKELALLSHKMKSGGYIMFNDYTRWSITEVLPYGVQSAVNEFMVKHNLPMAAIALTGTGHYDVLLQMK